MWVEVLPPSNRSALATSRWQPLRVLVATPRFETTPTLPSTVGRAVSSQGMLMACGASQALQFDVVTLEEGPLSGEQLAALGVQVAEVLGSLSAS